MNKVIRTGMYVIIEKTGIEARQWSGVVTGISASTIQIKTDGGTKRDFFDSEINCIMDDAAQVLWEG